MWHASQKQRDGVKSHHGQGLEEKCYRRGEKENRAKELFNEIVATKFPDLTNIINLQPSTVYILTVLP